MPTNTKRQTTHPLRRARRERALRQRSAEKLLWEGPEKNHPRVCIRTPNADLRVDSEVKVSRCQTDIENLKAKLGPVYSEVSE